MADKAPLWLRTALLATLAMVAFAANSVLTRMALADTSMGAASFTLIRILSGGLVLFALAGPRALTSGNWAGGASLLAYAGLFSFAYLALGSGVGALILFFLVQITMVGWGLFQKKPLSLLQWSGLALACVSLVWLLLPGAEAPPIRAALVMAGAGISWGIYSLLGRNVSSPTSATAGNFLRASVMALILCPALFFLLGEPLPSWTGFAAALASGALASGLGYALWYAVLPALSPAQAGALQLTVPVLAALGGILFLSEPITLTYILASAGILTGVALVILRPSRK